MKVKFNIYLLQQKKEQGLLRIILLFAVASVLGLTVGPAGATGFEQARQLLKSQQMRAVEGAEYSGVRNAVSDFINAKGNSTLYKPFY